MNKQKTKQHVQTHVGEEIYLSTLNIMQNLHITGMLRQYETNKSTLRQTGMKAQKANYGLSISFSNHVTRGWLPGMFKKKRKKEKVKRIFTKRLQTPTVVF